MTDSNTDSTPLLSDKNYNLMKTFVQLWLPAFATLYMTVATIWGLPNPQGVVATIVAITTFLGIVLRISTKSYENSGVGNVGTLVVSNPTPDSLSYSLELNGDPADLQFKDSVTFKVANAPTVSE
jgi:hypothetical protein